MMNPDHAIASRRTTPSVRVGTHWVGSAHPIVVQSMTNTDTADVASTVKQVAQLWRAGSEAVRVTVNNAESAAAVPRIAEKLAMMGVEVPIIGDFHYNGHQLLTAEPSCAEALAKYRINPGNVGFGKKRDSQFGAIIELANRYEKPVRIGVNWGSLDQGLAQRLMDENAERAEPWSAAKVLREALVRSALDSAAQAEQLGSHSISALAPSYFKPRSLDVLIACCAEVGSGTVPKLSPISSVCFACSKSSW